MPFDPREPIDAILVTDELPPPRRTRRWLLGGGCLFASLICMGLAFWLLARFYGLGGPSANNPVVQWESAAEKQAGLLRAFDGRRRTLQDPDLAEIQRLLRRLAATAGREDNAEFQKLIDFGRMAQRIQSHAGVGRINWLERQILASQIRTDSDGPANAQDFRIVHLDRPAEDHVVVYAYAVNTEVSGDPFKFWLARTRDGWRVYDWERIELGWSEATQYARLQIAAAHPHSDSYDEGSEKLVAADESTEEEKFDEAAEHLQAAARHAVPPVVADFWSYLVAIRWSSLDRSDECLAWCRRAKNPDEIPGFYTLQAVHLRQMERHEEALAAIENYERVAGFQPEVVRMKAESLTALQRREEALTCWRQLVQFAPDGMNDLSAFCDALPAGRRAEVLDVIQTAEQPIEVATQLAQRWVCREDGQLLSRLQQFVAARSPGSPEALQLEGRVLQYEGEYEQAADRFRQAAEQELDPEKRDGCWSSFQQAMVDAGQIVPAYEAMPDLREAFQRLAGGIEDGDAMIDYDQLPLLLAAHRRRCPDDAWLPYFAGLLADQNNEPEQAAREFAAAERSEDEEVKSSAGYQLRDLLCRQGKVLEAYQRGSGDAEIFRELADHCRFNDDAQSLQTLLKTRRSEVPDEPWLGYYTAVLLNLERQPEAALRSLDGHKKTEDEDLETALNALRLQLLLELGRWRDAYTEQPDEAFPQVASRLRARRDWAALSQLCDLHRQRDPDDGELLWLRVLSAAEQKDDQGVVQLLTPWPEDQFKGEYRASQARWQLVRSLLRLGRGDEARQFAAESAKRDQTLLLSLLIWQRRWDEVATLLKDESIAEQFAEHLRYASREDLLQAYRTDEGAAALRKRFPMPLPEETAGSRIVLLLRTPAELTAERLQALAQGDSPFEVRPLPTLRSEVTAVFEVCDASGRAVVAAGSGGYCDPRWLKRTRVPDAGLLAILKGHGAWITVQGAEADDEDDMAAVERLVRRIAAGLLDANVQAVNVWGLESATARLAAVDETTTGRLLSETRLEDAFTDAPKLFLEPRGDESETAAPSGIPLPRRELLALVKSLQSPSQDRPPWIRVRLQLGEAGEEHWLRAVSAKHTRWGDIEFVGEFCTGSELWPHLKPGERAIVTSSEVRRWTTEKL